MRIQLTESGFDGIAQQFRYADENFGDVTRPLLYSSLKNMPLKKIKVLDLGCGYGQDMAYFHKKGAFVSGIDKSTEMVRIATKKCPYASIVRGSFERLPYKNKQFDLVFSRYSIQHSFYTKKVFSEILRVLKPSGHLLFLVTHPLRQYLEKSVKDYWRTENVSTCILGGKVTVSEPTHRLEEYFSPFLLKNLELLSVKEAFDPGAQRIGNQKYPGILVCHYQKNRAILASLSNLAVLFVQRFISLLVL